MNPIRILSAFAERLSAAWAWRRLDHALARWRRAGRRPRLWWRDDDAREPTLQLTRLLGLSERFGVPLTLAVIPDADRSALFALLDRRELVSIAQHGVDHKERTTIAGRRAEFRPEASVERIRERIARGWRLLSQHPRAVPVYVPPWNHATPNVLAALEATPHRVLSLYGDAQVQTGLSIVNASVDVMRWRPPRFRGTAAVAGRIARLLDQRRRRGAWNEPIGLLTHHFNHDEATWCFLERLLGRVDGSVEWMADPGR